MVACALKIYYSICVVLHILCDLPNSIHVVTDFPMQRVDIFRMLMRRLCSLDISLIMLSGFLKKLFLKEVMCRTSIPPTKTVFNQQFQIFVIRLNNLTDVFCVV